MDQQSFGNAHHHHGKYNVETVEILDRFIPIGAAASPYMAGDQKIRLPDRQIFDLLCCNMGHVRADVLTVSSIINTS